jgi:hypothetical protein
VLLPPSNWDSMTYNLARVLLFQGEGSLFLKNFTYCTQAMYPWGYDILSFLFLRFYSDFGLSLFSFLSYTVIIVGTYGLVNKIFNNPSLSLTSCFIIASLKEIVLQATTTKNDIPMAAIAVICFLAGYNFFRSFKYVHLYIMSIALLFGLSVKGYFWGFMFSFLFFYLLLLVKEYSPKKLLQMVKPLIAHGKTPLLLPLGLLFCLIVYWVNNFSNYGNISGEKAFVEMHLNKDGFLGGVVNVGRYMLQAAELPEECGGAILTEMHNKVLGKYQSIAARPVFHVPPNLSGEFIPFEDSSWYGPLGLLLIIPSIFYSLFKGKGFIRVISLTLLAFLWILSYKPAWMPWNGRYFSLFFGGGGACVAVLVNRLQEGRYLKSILLTISCIILFYAALFNVKKPFTSPHEIVLFTKKIVARDMNYLAEKIRHPGSLVFRWGYYVVNRNAYFDEHFASRVVVSTFTNAIEPNKRVLLIGFTDSWIFPFFIRRPDLRITVARPEHILLGAKVYNINDKEDYLYLRNQFDYLLCSSVKLNDDIVNSYIKKEKMHFYVDSTAVLGGLNSLYEFTRTMNN